MCSYCVSGVWCGAYIGQPFDQLVGFLSSSVKITLHVTPYCKTPQLFVHEFESVSDSPVSGTVTI